MATKLKGTAGNVSMEDFASNLKTIQSQNSGVDQAYTYEGSPEVTTYVPKQPTVSNITTPPVKIPDPITTPTTGNLGMATDSALAGIQANTQVQTEDEKAKAELAKTRDGLLKSIGEQGTQVADAYKDADYVQKKANAVKIQNELTAMEKAYRDEIAGIEKNTQGKLESGIVAEKNRAIDRYNNNRANVSIAYNTALGDFNAAKDAVDLKVQSIKDYNTNYLKTYELIKDSVYNNMTESEKVQANNLQREKEAKANIINATYADVVSNAAQNGAPASVLSAIDAAARDPKATAATITAAAGRYNVKPTEGNVTGTIDGKPQNVSQSAANSYANRLNESNVILSNLGGNFTGKAAIGGSLPNILQSGDRQAFEQAKKNFVTAVLRRESGASIAPSEFKTAEEIYFPVAGDQPETVTQKENLRNTVINNFYREANVLRPVLPGQIIEADGKRYKIGADGETLEEIK